MGCSAVWDLGLGRGGSSSPSPPHPPFVIPSKTTHPPPKLIIERGRESREKVIYIYIYMCV